MRDFISIVKRNFLQPIVVAILVLASILLLLGEQRDALFVSFVITINTLFAIVQEIRARRALKRLELMNAPVARRINNDGTVSEVSPESLVEYDRIDVRLGDEIPADGTVVSSRGLEVNESLLTGESAAIHKREKQSVYASSSVVAGSAIVKVAAVGADTRVGGMTKTLRKYEARLTPLQRSIFRMVTFMTYAALGLAALIFTVYFYIGLDAITIIKAITSSAVTIVPEGLLLASTLLLAFGSLRLARAKVLPQKLSAIEGMALVDVLAVDKTGTLTSDAIQFSELIAWDGAPRRIDELVGIAALETSSGNATGDAMISGLPQPDAYTVKDRLPFSSDRKYSGVRVTLGRTAHTILVGAPEFLSHIAPLSKARSEQIAAYTKTGNRVLLVVRIEDAKMDLRAITSRSGLAIGIVVLTNELRSGVEKTVRYLQANNVSIRVISGDNIDTVRAVADQAGIEGADKGITGAELSKLADDEWRQAADETVIFARVLPEQKEQLIAHFRDRGKFTGMVGDGVNDALALKQADLSVAMFAGASATRRVADIVLLNNSFNALPLGMRLGNRLMLAIEMIATLFFHKIIYGVVLLLTTLALSTVYPFMPRHVTFMNIFLVTMPTVLWTLFPPLPTYKISPKRFWWDTLAPVAPIAVISGVVVALSYLRLSWLHPEDPQGVATTVVLIATFFGVYLVVLMRRMFRAVNNRTAKLARILYMLLVVFVAVVSFGFGVMRDFFDFSVPALTETWSLISLVAIAAILQWLIADSAGKAKKQMNKARK